MTLQDQFSESTAPALQSRVMMAYSKAAQDISSEATDTPNHPARVALANSIARVPESYRVSFTTLLCAEGITGQSADTEISTMVAAVWNTVAGSTPAAV
jgi:hypothetical protein